MSVPTEKHPQVLDRKYRTAKDAHGRPWGANISGKTAEPIESLKPFGWHAPYIPAPQYVRWIDDDEQGTRRVEIDYQADFNDRLAALDLWTKELWRRGTEIAKDSFDPENPSPMVLAKVGPKPASPDIPKAVLNEVPGYEWLLGLSDERPAWADKLFPPTPATDLSMFDVSGEGSPDKPRRGRPRATAA